MSAAPDAAIRPEAHSEAGRFYLPELDSLRLFAFLAVFACHCAIAVRILRPSGCAAWGFAFLAALAAAIGIADCSYRWFEHPFIQAKKRFFAAIPSGA